MISDDPWSLQCCTTLIAVVMMKQTSLSVIEVVLRVVAINGVFNQKVDACVGRGLRADRDEPTSPVEALPNGPWNSYPSVLP